jgi:exopolysaccharide production protein ExoQ
MHLPPTIALLLTVAFIVFLFRRDTLERPNVSHALWLPFLWMVLTCSRAFSGWLTIFGLPMGAASLEEGSPLDACFYFGLIVAGIYVLNARQVQLSEFARSNPWLVAFFLYSLVSIVWSDFPLVAFKRWIKIVGHPVMALIVLTEPNSEEGLIRLLKRCAYVVLPVSILFIKYYPQWGRSFDAWAGIPANNGIAEGKNMLGADLLILGFFFIWYSLRTWRAERGASRRNELILVVVFSIMTGWLFSMVHSSTSVGSLLVGVSTLFFVGRPWVNKNFIGTYMLLAVAVLAVAEIAFGISGFFIGALGRDPTLTGRTEIWGQLLDFHTNPIFGVGFESFWLGDRIRTMQSLYRFPGNQAHNGYLETYLNLGLLGLFVLIAWIVASFRKIRFELFRSFESARFRLGLLVALIVYNWTEASFTALHPLWFVFFLITTDYQRYADGFAETGRGLESSAAQADWIYDEEEIEITRRA